MATSSHVAVSFPAKTWQVGLTVIGKTTCSEHTFNVTSKVPSCVYV